MSQLKILATVTPPSLMVAFRFWNGKKLTAFAAASNVVDAKVSLHLITSTDAVNSASPPNLKPNLLIRTPANCWNTLTSGYPCSIVSDGIVLPILNTCSDFLFGAWPVVLEVG